MKVHYISPRYVGGWAQNIAVCRHKSRTAVPRATSVLSEVTCSLCLSNPDYLADLRAATETAQASDETDKSAIVADLLDRALFLGYDDQAAADLADCLDVPHTYEPCPDHPGHSTIMDKWGYAVDECEAHTVLRMSTETGYTVTAVAERRESARRAHVKYLNEVIRDAAASGECACWAVTERGASELPQGGEVCMGCGSVFTPEGIEPSGVVTALSDYVVRRRGGITGTPEQLRADLNVLASVHWANANSTDPFRANGDGVVYLGSQADLRMAFETAYPGLMWDVFVEIMSDNMPTDNICGDIVRIRETMPGYLETGDRHGTPVTGDQGPDLPDLPQAPCTRARLEHTATLASDATYAAAHDRTLMAMCRAYIRGHKPIHRSATATGYTLALIDYVRIAFPDLTQEQTEMVVCEGLADACADLAD